MADHTPSGPVETGAEMDYSEHEKTYKLFLGMAKYGSLFCVALLLAMAFGFFTTAGFFSATILFVADLRGRRLSCCADCRRTSPETFRRMPAAACRCRHASSSRKDSAVGQTVFVPKEIDRERGARRGLAGHGEAARRRLASTSSSKAGAGLASRIVDADFAAAGATIGKASDAGKADVVLKVRRPTEAELKGYKSGAAVLAIMDPYGNDAALAAMAKAGVTAFAMEFMPRITRAQSMDVLSSPGQPRRLPGGDRRRRRI